MTDHPGKAILADLQNGLDGVTPGPWSVSFDGHRNGPDESWTGFLTCADEMPIGIIDMFVLSSKVKIAEVQPF